MVGCAGWWLTVAMACGLRPEKTRRLLQLLQGQEDAAFAEVASNLRYRVSSVLSAYLISSKVRRVHTYFDTQ